MIDFVIRLLLLLWIVSLIGISYLVHIHSKEKGKQLWSVLATVSAVLGLVVLLKVFIF